MPIHAASNSNSEKPPQEDNYQPSSCLSSLPDDVVLNCLTRVPRCDHLNMSCVSKTLRSLVRSPELCRLRSCLPKKSVYLFYHNYQEPQTYHWITLRRSEKMITTHDYQMEHRSCSLAEIYFTDHGCSCPSRNLWVLDTRSGTIRMGPSMKVARWAWSTGRGVVDRKIYAIGGTDGESQLEVFDPETQTWEFAGEEKVQCESRFSASLENKVYMVDSLHRRINAYSPREGISNEATERLTDQINYMCVVENVIYAWFKWSGLKWFDTKLKVWRRLVDSYGKVTFSSISADRMAEFEGKLAVFSKTIRFTDAVEVKMEIWCKIIALDRVGEEILGKIEWRSVKTNFPTTKSAYSVNPHRLASLAPPQPRPNFSRKPNNKCYKKLRFVVPSETAMVHGFAGCFEAILYDKLRISTAVPRKAT
ncbi:hypothetical protein Bca101_081686 [Brassica carinata]